MFEFLCGYPERGLSISDLFFSSLNCLNNKSKKIQLLVCISDVPVAERDEMKRKSVNEGESVTLDPGVMNNPKDLMTWLFNDSPINEIPEEPTVPDSGLSSAAVAVICAATVVGVLMLMAVSLYLLHCLVKRKDTRTKHSDKNEVPHIALLGSGGGQRAMVGLLGSLVELDKAGLLDCMLYLNGVSGSTWCMASLYQEPDWSTKLDTVKDKIIKRLSGPEVSWGDAYAKLKKYHKKDNFSLTDVWAVMVVTEYVKEIDEHKLTDQWDQLSKDPFPIYAAIDKQCKQKKDGDPWFEISPHEAGYSLTGAFVETSSFCSQFDNGSKKKQQPEMDMLYLQDPKDPPVEMYYQVLMDLVDMNLSVLNGKDPSDLDQSIRKLLNDLFLSICTCMAKWIWGRNYNFLHKMTDEAVPAALLESETRDYEDAGLLLNSPYFSVLREERHIDLIISLDYSDGDPFMTVRKAAEMCKKLNIPFPEVNIPSEDLEKPKDFYVFKGQNAPTVIHIPLFNVVNCGGKLRLSS
ncbi:cytosolic phospholipase A2 gamma-like protein [Labeo rohita]|uniref:Cytosolic phospholipase A2 gamma-like protein n=1 Tax=Labeo rohita TaxID=84645 RepID=A0A498LV00_LABRO|nr:cytosolic phospholipase A2 gamma-like protein [Labeo rohita]